MIENINGNQSVKFLRAQTRGGSQAYVYQGPENSNSNPSNYQQQQQQQNMQDSSGKRDSKIVIHQIQNNQQEDIKSQNQQQNQDQQQQQQNNMLQQDQVISPEKSQSNVQYQINSSQKYQAANRSNNHPKKQTIAVLQQQLGAMTIQNTPLVQQIQEDQIVNNSKGDQEFELNSNGNHHNISNQSQVFNKNFLHLQTLQNNPNASNNYQNLLASDIQNKENYIDLDQFPPDLDVAFKHGKAQRQCKYIDYANNKQEKCKCCGKVIDNELLRYCDHPDNLQHVGTTYPLYFTFIKQCGIMMTFCALLQSLPALIMFSRGNYCKDVPNVSFICYISVLNVVDKESEETLSILSVINFIMIFIILILIEFFRIYQDKKVKEFEQDRKSVSYYSMIIKHFPDTSNIEELEQYLEKHIPGSKDQISKIFLLYNLNEYDHLSQNRKKAVDEYNKHKFRLQQIEEQLKKQDKTLQNISDLQPSQQIEIKNLQAIINDQERIKAFQEDCMSELYDILIEQSEKNIGKFKGKSIRDNYTKNHLKYKLKFTGKIIITFETQQIQRQVKQYFQKNVYDDLIQALCSQKYKQNHQSKFYLGGKRLLIKQAPEPSDILWTGIASIKNKKLLRIKSNFYVYFTMLIFLLILIFFKVTLRTASQEYSAFWQLVIGLGAATLVAIANVVTGIIIRKNATKEDRTSQTSYFVQVGRKLTKMFLINMLLTIFFSALVYNIWEEKGDTTNFINSTLGEYFMLFITNSYISSFMSISDIVWIVRLIKRHYMIKSIQEQKCWKSQAEANDVFEGHPIDMALRYANVLKVVLYTLAIASLLPIGGFLCLIGLFIIYWADKHLLFRRMVCKNYISILLSQEMLHLLHFSVVLFALGNFITLFMPIYQEEDNSFNFKNNSRGYGYFFLSFLGIIVAIAFHYIPRTKYNLTKIYQKFDKNSYENKFKNLTYTQLKELIFDDYDLYHPASRQYAVERINKLQNQKQSDINKELQKDGEDLALQQQDDNSNNNNELDLNSKNKMIQENDKQNFIKKQQSSGNNNNNQNSQNEQEDDIRISREPETLEFEIKQNSNQSKYQNEDQINEDQQITNNQNQEDEALNSCDIQLNIGEEQHSSKEPKQNVYPIKKTKTKTQMVHFNSIQNMEQNRLNNNQDIESNNRINDQEDD